MTSNHCICCGHDFEDSMCDEFDFCGPCGCRIPAAIQKASNGYGERAYVVGLRTGQYVMFRTASINGYYATLTDITHHSLPFPGPGKASAIEVKMTDMVWAVECDVTTPQTRT